MAAGGEERSKQMARSIASLPQGGDVLGGNYRLGRELGRGSFGVVFEAEQLDLRRRVALKVMLPRALAREDVAERFKREALLASSLTSPHVASVYAFGVWGEAPGVDGLPYMVMEHLQGEDLYYLLARRGALTVQETLTILSEGLSALAEAHGRGILHRDLKPENVFIAWSGDHYHVKILDFGIARAINGTWEGAELRRLTAVGMVCGTPEFMAPEQASGEPDLTPAVDVYAMGCLGYQMLTGRLPYTGNSPMDIALKHMSEPLPSLPPEFEGSPLEGLLRRAMAKHPEERFPDAGAFQRAVEQVAIHHGLPLRLNLGDEPESGEFLPAEAARLTTDNQPMRHASDDALPTRVQVRAPSPAHERLYSTLEPSLPTRVEPRKPHPELPATYMETVVHSLSPPSQRRAWLPLLLGMLAVLGLLGFLVALAVAPVAPPDAPPRAEAKLTLDSVPSGASVSRAGRALGLTPLVLPCSDAPVQLERDGFEPLQATLPCRADAPAQRTLTLQPATAPPPQAPATAAAPVSAAMPQPPATPATPPDTAPQEAALPASARPAPPRSAAVRPPASRQPPGSAAPPEKVPMW